MRQIQTNSDISIREDRAVLDNRAIVDMAVAFNIAAASDKTLRLHLRSPPDIDRSNDSRVPVYLGSIVDPNPGSGFYSQWAESATGSKTVRDESPQVPRMLKAIHVPAHQIANRTGGSQSGLQIFEFRDAAVVDDPYIQRSLIIKGTRHSLALFAMKLKQIFQVDVNVGAHMHH